MGTFNMNLGNVIDRIGTTFNAKERGWSEAIAGNRPTTNTGVTASSRAANYVPYTPANYSPNVPTNVYTPSSQGKVLGVAAPTTSTTQKTTSQSKPAPSAPPTLDLSNRAKQDDYARSFGFPGWNEMQAAQNQQQQQSNPNQDWLNSINQEFDNLLSGLGGQQEQSLNYARANADTQKAGINEQLQFGVNDFNAGREQIRNNQATSLAGLSQSLRDSSRNVSNILGAKGANGSATDAASYALTKLYGNQRAGVMDQSRDQMFELDSTENNLKASAAQMLNDVDTWFNSTAQDISTKYNDLRNNIGSMKAGARLDAVAQLESEYRSAVQRRDEIAQGVQQSAMQRLQQLSDYRTQLQGKADFTPEQQVYAEYGFNPTDYQPDDGFSFNPAVLAKRKRDQGLI